MEEESCVPVQAERKGPVREVKDLREVKASGAQGSRTSWMATVEHPAKADSEPHGRKVGTRGGQTRIGFCHPSLKNFELLEKREARRELRF